MAEVLHIAADGGVVSVRRLGFRDLLEFPAAIKSLGEIDASTDEGEAELRALWLSLCDRMDAYSAGGTLPSQVPGSEVRSFIARWAGEVRDAAAPLPSAAPSPPTASATRKSPRRRP